MTIRLFLFCALLLTTAQRSPAQHDPLPYADQDERALKALSSETVGGYRAGQGMGLAKAAELNHYPGPKHVLDHGDALGLSGEQRAAIRDAYDAMHQQAVRLGQRIIKEEEALDRLFDDQRADSASVQARTAEIAALKGELRMTHLAAHLKAQAVLTKKQIRHYDALRGYGTVRAKTSAHSHVATADSAQVVQTVKQFHEALVQGDSAAAASLLTPEALILEDGSQETKTEYLGHHFHSDHAFLSTMTRQPRSRAVHVQGDAAWAASTSRLQGHYRDRDLSSAELMVLRRTPEGWKIAAIHWSSHSRE